MQIKREGNSKIESFFVSLSIEYQIKNNSGIKPVFFIVFFIIRWHTFHRHIHQDNIHLHTIKGTKQIFQINHQLLIQTHTLIKEANQCSNHHNNTSKWDKSVALALVGSCGYAAAIAVSKCVALVEMMSIHTIMVVWVAVNQNTNTNKWLKK